MSCEICGNIIHPDEEVMRDCDAGKEWHQTCASLQYLETLKNLKKAEECETYRSQVLAWIMTLPAEDRAGTLCTYTYMPNEWCAWHLDDFEKWMEEQDEVEKT